MTMLTTPAIASEPYCAEAPSRNTSMRSIALCGIVFRSTPLEPAPMPYVVVDQGGLVPSPAVQQHQRLIGGEAPQGERAADVPGVGDALVRKVDRRGERLQDLARLRRPLALDIIGPEHVDRDCQLVRGRVTGTGPDRHVHGRERDRLDDER